MVNFKRNILLFFVLLLCFAVTPFLFSAFGDDQNEVAATDTKNAPANDDLKSLQEKVTSFESALGEKKKLIQDMTIEKEGLKKAAEEAYRQQKASQDELELFVTDDKEKKGLLAEKINMAKAPLEVKIKNLEEQNQIFTSNIKDKDQQLSNLNKTVDSQSKQLTAVIDENRSLEKESKTLKEQLRTAQIVHAR